MNLRPGTVNSIIYSLLSLFVLGFALQTQLDAEEAWISLATPHFTLYTTGSEKSGLQMLQQFEEARAFFLQTSFRAAVPQSNVTVVAFSNEKEYEPYRANPGAFAYYQHNHRGDFIVMQSLDVGNYRIAVHEYTHCILRHAGLRLPLWLNEGLAEVYSSLQTDGPHTTLGAELPGHIYTLQHRPGIDLQTMFQVDRGSPYYTRPEQMWVFYAHSWALAHMLLIESSYSVHFSEFLDALSQGQSPTDAFQTIYGKDLAQVEKDLLSYFGQKQLPRLQLAPNSVSSFPDPLLSMPQDVELTTMLAGLVSPSLAAEPVGAASPKATR